MNENEHSVERRKAIHLVSPFNSIHNSFMESGVKQYQEGVKFIIYSVE